MLKTLLEVSFVMSDEERTSWIIKEQHEKYMKVWKSLDVNGNESCMCGIMLFFINLCQVACQCLTTYLEKKNLNCTMYIIQVRDTFVM